MKPTVGRIVRYVSHGTPVRGDGSQAFPPVEEIAAIITQVDPEDPERVGLHVFNPLGDFKQPLATGGVIHDEGRAPGTWHWTPIERPEREDAADLLLAASAGDAPAVGCCRGRSAGDEGAADRG